MARIAYYGSGGSPYHHAAILGRAGHEAAFVFAADIAAGALSGFDAFVMPGGGYRGMQGQLEPLGRAGCRAIREYVESGGMYLGSCAGSYDAATVPAGFRDLCPEQAELCLVDARVWNADDDALLRSPGIGVLLARNADPGHPVMAGIGPEFRITHYNGPLFAGGHALATVSAPTQAFTAAEDFFGDGGGPALLLRGAAEGVANIVTERRGAGRVVLFGSHPEFGSAPAMDDVADAARMLRNAIDWQLAETGGVDGPRPAVAMDAPIPDEVRSADLAALPALVERITEGCAALAARTADAPWLAADTAPASFGRTPVLVWEAGLREIPLLAAAAAARAPALPPALLSFRPPASWAVDIGFHGVVPLLERTADLVAAAIPAWRDGMPGPVTELYQYLMESPYHLVAGSYMAAIGHAAAAALLVRSAG